MNSLKKYKLDELYQMSSGISTKPEQAGHGAPFCSFSTVFNNYFLPPVLPDKMDTSEAEQRTYSLLEGDVLLTRTSETLDELGMSSVAAKDYPKATFSGFLKRLRPMQKDIAYHKFMAFYLRSPLFRKAMNNNAVMTLRCSLNEEIFSYLSVLLPSFDQQVKIGDFLYQIYAKIELNQRMNEELEGMAKLLYDYWFVQYDFPMSAAQASALGKPKLQGHPYRASGGPMTCHETLKREIPTGWEVGQIADLCHLNQSTWGNANQPQSVNYLDLANAKEGKILGVKEYAWDEAPSRARRILTPGDTIIGMVRPGNRSFAMVPQSETTITGSTGFAVLTPKSALYREFNYLSLTSESNIDRLTTVASGAAYPAVNPEVVAAHSIAIPGKELIASFHEKVRSMYDLMETNEQQTQELTTLRDWLLPMLMNGQVTVGGSECHARHH